MSPAERFQARPQRQPRRPAAGPCQGHSRAGRRGRHKLAELWCRCLGRNAAGQRQTRSLEAPGRQGLGQGGGVQPQEGDPLDLAALEGAAESSGRRSFGWLAIPSRDGTLGPDRHS